MMQIIRTNVQTQDSNTTENHYNIVVTQPLVLRKGEDLQSLLWILDSTTKQTLIQFWMVIEGWKCKLGHNITC